MLNKNILPVVLTKNEQSNIEKCLRKLNWAKKVLVFDSYSNDKTIYISKKFSNVQIIPCKSNLDYVDKLNYINFYTQNKFIFLLDADYECSNQLVRELSNFNPSNNIFGYKFKIYNKLFGKILKEELYPSKVLLFKSKKNLFKKFGHKEVLKINGPIKELKNYIIHEDKKSFKAWIKNQFLYSIKDSKKICEAKYQNLTISNKLRRIPFLMNVASFVYYTFKLNLLRFGTSGLAYILARQVYETFLSINIVIFFLKKIFKIL